ncbi:MAG: hypothetical protein HZA84_01245 [Thaumarchaeota archaeon]|nr:hypothetical protein [Nitrososphaerota archaeon]
MRAFVSRLRLKLENDENFIKREPTPLLLYETADEIKDDLEHKLDDLIKKFPKVSNVRKPVCEIIANLSSSQNNGLLLLNEYHSLLDVELKWLPEETKEGRDFIEISADKNSVNFTILKDTFEFSEIGEAVNLQQNNGKFLAQIIELNQSSRIKSEKKTIEQLAAIEACYYKVSMGAQIPLGYQGLGTAGFRDVQTCLSIADPGDGHINITSHHKDLLHGSIIHIEHIDRDKEANKEIIEPYRLPALRNVSKVRLHFGSSAPCTVFIGRPIFENHKIGTDQNLFHFDLLKTSHLISSACSAMFAYGIADCKIAIERMTVSQAITFMKAVVGNVVRDENTQYLSAAFNINTPIIDDRSNTPIEISNRFQIASIGIEIAFQGGFEKITWDGASNQIPSVPIIEQLTHEQIVELVHRSHELGLETYISAGMRPDHMELAVHTGVDGVGIGTSLHYSDPDTKLMGALKPEAIGEVLIFRDQAEKSTLGKAAKMLARLDRMFFEKLLTEEQNQIRLMLYQQLKNKETQLLEKTLSDTTDMEDLPAGGHPIIQQGQRFLFCAKSTQFAPNPSKRFLNDVIAAIKGSDIDRIKHYLHTQRKDIVDVQ